MCLFFLFDDFSPPLFLFPTDLRTPKEPFVIFLPDFLDALHKSRELFKLRPLIVHRLQHHPRDCKSYAHSADAIPPTLFSKVILGKRCSGIAIYSQVRAKFRYTFLWTMLFFGNGVRTEPVRARPLRASWQVAVLQTCFAQEFVSPHRKS
jgi:hypothetical protein